MTKLLFLLVWMITSLHGQNLDRFTYGPTVSRASGGTDYGPEDWEKVICPDPTQCIGYPDTWSDATGWSLPTTMSDCYWCPADGPSCNVGHHQSPIGLTRQVADYASPLYNNCTDDHWMEYHDSSCTWEDLKSKNAFSIERHALRVSIPITDSAYGYMPDCGQGKWGVIDFSNGFKWWLLSHTELHLPSEHTQNGKRYDAEIQMYHLYSLQEYQMATIAFYVQAYEDIPDEPYLNKLICEWRKAEDKTREQCSLSSVPDIYPGCWPCNRPASNGKRRHTEEQAKGSHSPKTAYDVVKEQWLDGRSFPTKRMKFANVDDPQAAFDVKEYLRQEQMNRNHSHRELLNYEHITWFSYWPMLSVRTEYYHRYFGSATVPPCFGGLLEHAENLWRIMKDPIRISKRQLNELHRLLIERIAPYDDPVKPCKPDTAGVVDGAGRIAVARPLQESNINHDSKFCSCDKWRSKWPEDQEWCSSVTFKDRQTKRPYNFETNGY